MKKLHLFFACFLVLVLFGCASDKGFDKFKNMTAQQILTLGETNLEKHNFSEATKNFEALDALYPFDLATEQGQLDTIYAYYKNDDFDLAAVAANRYIHLYPRGKHTDYAYYMKGLASFERGRTWLQRIYPSGVEQRDLAYVREAFVDFNDLVRIFPESIYAKDARVRMIYARDLLAQHEFNIANFYFERKAYVAAANRASYIVRHFEGAEQVAPSLKIMIKSYQELGAKKQAQDALKVLHTNFPGEKL